MKTSCIYAIQSKVKPNRIYVGSAINFYQRRHCHLSQLKLGQHGNIKLVRHVNKYGLSDLKFIIVEEIDNVINLIPREQHYIDLLNPYFNIDKIAGSRLGSKVTRRWNHTDETRKKMSESAKGITKRKAGFRHSKETIEKMKLAQQNRSADFRHKISLSKIGGKHHNAKKVMDLETSMIYECANYAAGVLSVGKSAAYHCIN